MSAALQKLEQSIKAQADKLSQLKAKKQRLEAHQRSKLLGQERQKDTRRKVLLGALLMEMMTQDEDTKRKVLARLDTFLIRDNDRALFGLHVVPARPETMAPSSAPTPQRETALQR